ncbi:MAG: GNAT family N-acetyltransferase [Alphaproteobacteria bacterium]
MPDGSDAAMIRVLDGIDEVDAVAWDACAGTADPFVGHAFLKSFEDCGSVSPKTGWTPRHLVLEDDDGGLAACAPLYLKSHSYGEYVFDWAWADAYGRAGGRYYPKLLSGVPFTPVGGQRLLVRHDLPEATRRDLKTALISGMIELARGSGVSSLHINFIKQDDWRLCGDLGLLQRTGRQFHWFNDGYADFDGFLAALTSRKRKAIRKERRQVEESGVEIRRLSGSDIEPRHWDAFYAFYRDTSERKWGEAYLNREFFHLLGRRMADRVLLVIAEKDGGIVGGALNMIGDDALYGRYWGCSSPFRFLHFEACYYQAIDYAIDHGLARVEAGAQGEHKLSRGYLAHATYSAHWIAAPGFRDAVARFLSEESAAVGDEIDILDTYTPFKRG